MTALALFVLAAIFFIKFWPGVARTIAKALLFGSAGIAILLIAVWIHGGTPAGDDPYAGLGTPATWDGHAAR